MKQVSLLFFLILVFVFSAYSQSNCTYTVAGSSSFAYTGGNINYSITTQAGCAWTVASSSEWLTITGAKSGVGSGTTSVAVAENTGTKRTGQVTVAGIAQTVTQFGIPCVYTFNPPTEAITAAGGFISYSVTSNHPDCRAEQHQFDDNISNQGFINPNFGEARRLELRFFISPFAGDPPGASSATERIKLYYLTQAARCDYTLNESAKSFAGIGGTGVYKLNTSLSVEQCQPAGGAVISSATTNVNWITIGNPSSSVTTGINYTVAPNLTSAPRTGTISYPVLMNPTAAPVFVALTITQEAAAPCAYTLSNDTLNIIGAGGNGAVNLTTASPCAWTASANVDWIVLTRTMSGTASGTVDFTVARNDGAARTGTITIGGQTFTVNQAAGKSRVRVKF